MRVLALVTLLLFVLSACTASQPAPVEKSPEPIACPDDSKTCPDGTVLTRVAPGCEFEKCPKIVRFFCQPGQRNADACPDVYQPVCARVDNSKTECAGNSCAKVSALTFSNSCSACAKENVMYYIEGECVERK